MITKKTAEQLVKRNVILDRINYCIDCLDDFASAEIKIMFNVKGYPSGLKTVSETIPLGGVRVIELLKELKAAEEANIEELNYLAVQEVQDTGAKE